MGAGFVVGLVAVLFVLFLLSFALVLSQATAASPLGGGVVAATAAAAAAATVAAFSVICLALGMRGV